jgi:predicted PhzF superfamily epimerase YddE/YHI9
VQTFLTKYWVGKLKRTKLKAFQSSERTGFMTVELQGDKVLIGGDAVIVYEGDFIGLD